MENDRRGARRIFADVPRIADHSAAEGARPGADRRERPEERFQARLRSRCRSRPTTTSTRSAASPVSACCSSRQRSAGEIKVDIAFSATGTTRTRCTSSAGRRNASSPCSSARGAVQEQKTDFNVRLVETISTESGVDEPREGKYRGNSFLGLSFNTFDIPRYMLTFRTGDAGRRWQRAVRHRRHHREREALRGRRNLQPLLGGWSTTNSAAMCSRTSSAMHSRASATNTTAPQVAYNDLYPKGMEPWEPNITALLDTANVKWGDLITAAHAGADAG